MGGMDTPAARAGAAVLLATAICLLFAASYLLCKSEYKQCTEITGRFNRPVLKGNRYISYSSQECSTVAD